MKFNPYTGIPMHNMAMLNYTLNAGLKSVVLDTAILIENENRHENLIWEHIFLWCGLKITSLAYFCKPK